MISTPESGVDSMAITYALLDPLMTIARPVVAFITAASAGITENLFSSRNKQRSTSPDLTCPVDGCCDGIDCPPGEHIRHHTFMDKARAGLNFVRTELWGDMAGWFFLGLLLAGFITALIPDEMIGNHLGGGLHAMLIMLVFGIPLYICATASTPIAAALILKGLSPGAALVFLLVGPATNVTSLTVLLGVLGKRATAIYLLSIAFLSVILGLALDQVYTSFDISAKAIAGHAGEIIPVWMEWTGAVILLILSVKPIYQSILKRFKPENEGPPIVQICDSIPGKTTEILSCAGTD